MSWVGVFAFQPLSLCGAHGHACAGPLRLGHQGAEPRPGRPGGRQADYRGCGEAGGGKKLAEELHRSESGGFTADGLSSSGAVTSSLTHSPAPSARPAGLQPFF